VSARISRLTRTTKEKHRMAFVERIIAFILGLFGLNKSPALEAGGAGASTGNGASASSDDDDDKPVDRNKYAQESWADCQRSIAQFEASGESLNGVDPQNPVTMHEKYFAYEAFWHESDDKEGSARKVGFRDSAHLDRVHHYIAAKWSVLGTNENGEPDVVIRDEYTNSMMQARMNQGNAARSAAANADPTLLQPENGVTVEQWAQASAAISRMPPNSTPQDMAKLLATIGIDRAQWDAANVAWPAKMQRDVTGVIAMKFGEAFAAPLGGGAAPTGEPISFDKYCEILGAQEAWAEQGLDINAELKKHFNIVAADLGVYGMYWSPKTGVDRALMRRYTELSSKFKIQYTTQGGGHDDDLRI